MRARPPLTGRARALGVAAGVALVLGLGCTTPSFESHYESAERALDRGDAPLAVAELESALELSRGRPIDAASLVLALSELGNLYLTYPDLGKEPHAVPMLEQAREMADEWLPRDSALHLTVLERLAGAYAAEGQWEDARVTLEHWIEGAERVYGPERTYRSPAASSLVEAYSRLGETGAADALRRRMETPLLGAGDGAPIAEFARDELYLEPNVLDADGASAYVHFARDDMPLRVALGVPEVAALHATLDETRQAAESGFRAWEGAVRRLYPWFELDVRSEHADPHIRARWLRAPPGYLPARGSIDYAVVEGELRVRSTVLLSAQPIPSATARVSVGELRAHAIHAFGSALGLADCWRCDSMMDMAWRRRDRVEITDLDLRTFEALMQLPNGSRTDGRPLVAMRAGEQPLGGGTPVLAPGVLADLPFINTGTGGAISVDLAAIGDRSFVVTLDTGAVDTVLTTDYARALGVSVRAAKSDAYRRDTITGEPIDFWVTGQHVVGGGRGPTHFNYALLGGKFMQDYVVEIDFRARRVRFLDPEQHRVGDRPEEAVVELAIRERRPYAEVALGTGTVWALVDTGAESTIATTEEKARTLGIAVDDTAPRTRHVNVLGSSLSSVQPLAGARMGPLELVATHVEIALRDDSQVRIHRWLQGETLVGVYLLENYRVRFDYPRQRLGLTPIEPSAPRFEEDVRATPTP